MNAKTASAVATDLQGEARDSARRIARDLFGAVPADGQRLTKAAFLDMLRRNWQDPNYRAALVTRIGDEAFLNAAHDAGLIGPWQEAAKQLEQAPGGMA